MFLELSEVLVCPHCRPAQGLVVLVDEIEGRQVREGHLGCPECEARVPVRGGVMRFDRITPSGARELETARPAPDAQAGSESVPGASESVDPVPDVIGEELEARVVEVAALLGVQEGGDYLLLGPGLAELAPGLARLAEGAEVVALDADPAGETKGVTWAKGVATDALPVVSGRLAGVALRGGTRASVAEAARVLAPGARLAVLRPTAGTAAAAREGGLEIAARERRALVAVRPG